MKIVQINATCGVGSTGNICVGISEMLNRERVENYILYSSRSSGYPQGIACSDDRYIRIQALMTKCTGSYGFHSKKATKKMIRELEQLQPDLVHLHNIHGHDCDLQTLFTYFKKKKTKLVWTFHDCWTFTGYCTYFDAAKCDKWKTHCHHCVQRKAYSWFFDRSRKLFEKKKELFSGLDLTIVTPSYWLAEQVKQSFLKDYPVRVIHNGIDLSVFSPQPSDFRKEYHLEHKKIVLGVSMEWGRRKGLDVFIQLAKRLPADYQIILVGTNSAVDQQLPDHIISIHRTENVQQLAQIYTASDVFANPTRDEVFGLVNVEALACGTPGVTFQSGGSPECYDETCGAVVPCDDVEAILAQIIRICEEKPFSDGACIAFSRNFDKEKKFGEYVSLYKEICS